MSLSSSSLRFFPPFQRRSCLPRCTRVTSSSSSSPSPPQELSYHLETTNRLSLLLLHSTPSPTSSPQTPFPLPTAFSPASSFSSPPVFSSQNVEMLQNRRAFSSSTTTKLHHLMKTCEETGTQKRRSSSSQEANSGEDEEPARSLRSSFPRGNEGDSYERRIRNAHPSRRRINHVDGVSCKRPNNNDFFISLPLSLRSSSLSSFHSLLSPSLLLLRSTPHKHHQTHARRDFPRESCASFTLLRLFSSSSSSPPQNSSSRPTQPPHSTSASTSSTSPPSTDGRKPSQSPALDSSSPSSCLSPPSIENSSTSSSLPSPVSPSNQPDEVLRLKGISQRDAELHGSALEAMVSY